MPRYRTIAGFRKDNWAAFKAANRDFVVLARELGLVGGALVGIDGAFFDGNASNRRASRRAARLKLILPRSDEERSRRMAPPSRPTTRPKRCRPPRKGAGMARAKISRKRWRALAKRAKVQADLARLDIESGETQLSRTDPDARILSKRGQVVAG